MISVVGKSACLASSLKLSSSIASSGNALSSVTIIKKKPLVGLVKPVNSPDISPSHQIGCFTAGQMKIRSGIGATTQVRFAHFEKFPDFDHYRHPLKADPYCKNKDSIDRRYSYLYLQTGIGVMAIIYTAKQAVRGAVASLGATEDVLAISTSEINISEIPEGKSLTFKWRNKPLFVKHRNSQQIAAEADTDLSSLRDPQTDASRTLDPKWLVVVGVCTHLGCVPIADAGDYGGYYCPCHGSHYDGSGRIRRGPAPTNLEVPKYSFPNPDLLIVG